MMTGLLLYPSEHPDQGDELLPGPGHILHAAKLEVGITVLLLSDVPSPPSCLS